MLLLKFPLRQGVTEFSFLAQKIQSQRSRGPRRVFVKNGTNSNISGGQGAPREQPLEREGLPSTLAGGVMTDVISGSSSTSDCFQKKPKSRLMFCVVDTDPQAEMWPERCQFAISDLIFLPLFYCYLKINTLKHFYREIMYHISIIIFLKGICNYIEK